MTPAEWTQEAFANAGIESPRLHKRLRVAVERAIAGALDEQREYYAGILRESEEKK